MGCDIHMVVQYRAKDGTWQDLPDDMAFGARNYDAFAILADVRNGRGFAGVETGSEFVPIAQPRGLPEDFELNASSERHRQTVAQTDEDDGDGLWMGDHSHSWVTLDELVRYPWGKGHTGIGIVSLATLRDWDGKTEPSHYSGGVSGPNVYTVSLEAGQALLRCGMLEQIDDMQAKAKTFDWPQFSPININVRIEWTETNAQAAGSLYSDYLPKWTKEARRRKLANKDIRLVFGFDS